MADKGSKSQQQSHRGPARPDDAAAAIKAIPKGPRRGQQRRARGQPQAAATAAAATAAAAAVEAADDIEAADEGGVDLDITLYNSRPEQTADSTYRPNIEPTDAIGSHFEPFNVPERPFQVQELPETPLKLFRHFLPIWLVAKWVRYTNDDPAAVDPIDPALGMPALYNKVNEWANVIMEAALNIISVSSIIGIDEAMQGFQGKSSQIVMIKMKPMPIGLKIWVLAVQEYILQWIWHRPGSKYGPIGIEGCQGLKVKTLDGSSDKPPPLNPTQAAVVALVNRLSKDIYHVFLDNIFSSPDLFNALRQLGIWATGTCCMNCGIYRQIVKLKEDDRKGQRMWPRGRLESWPTPDNKEMPC
ncbi:hypothetical protein S40285_04622 [Stachybotrys chlorohalonatus IBT 40285]|uniref:PiggyBac transposable element-derived protein domain-containing protein n=1 Tax=Stachybotrys chlorohalonatus (strain IBT 40285) TaxID=1283841 RepID=A0A084QZQ7_STAC4|nr:hypothetical protein S40285_04622 [Stachybotrys chlorohalonata IBT 40285]